MDKIDAMSIKIQDSITAAARSGGLKKEIGVIFSLPDSHNVVYLIGKCEAQIPIIGER